MASPYGLNTDVVAFAYYRLGNDCYVVAYSRSSTVRNGRRRGMQWYRRTGDDWHPIENQDVPEPVLNAMSRGYGGRAHNFYEVQAQGALAGRS